VVPEVRVIAVCSLGGGSFLEGLSPPFLHQNAIAMTFCCNEPHPRQGRHPVVDTIRPVRRAFFKVNKMNEQANKILLGLLQKASDGIDAAVSFSQAQIPDVINQLLIWKAASSFLSFLIGLLLIALGLG
jgi:hypothetical protein